jgi:cellulose synthase/poly-beta-1,6-N-acetylglucosamine synthase-like glycosyltransferase/peptidoglycan/xylan/chitin deacetylase (PgdA/CDA1 family)
VTKPIFQDRTGRRASRVTSIGWLIAVLTILLGGAFAVTLWAPSRMEAAKLPGQISALRVQKLEKTAADPALVRSAMQLAAEARAKRLKVLLKKIAARERNSNVHATAKLKHAGRPLSIAFYPNWELSAYDSLRVALPTLDWVVPTWLSLQGPDLKLKDAYSKKVDLLIRQRPKVAILPVIQNSTLGKWDGPGMAALLADPERRTHLVRQLSSYIAVRKLQGIVVDFESLPDAALPNLGLFLKETRAAFAPHGWTVAVAAPFANDKWPFADFARDVDYTLLMAYDEHASHGAPGSIAGQSWFEDLLDKRMEVLAPERTIVALGSYAYDWNSDDVDNLSFEEAVIAANDSDAKVEFDPQTNNPHFSYVEEDNTRHDVWLLDGVTAYNQIHAADLYRPAGYAVWRLGSEDPSIWSVFGRPYGASAPPTLRDIPTIEDIDFEGSGEFLRVEAQPQSGARNFEVEKATGDIDDETYTKLPTGYVIRQFGAAKKTVALTFDDGPDPEWTPQILDVLRAEHVPATFFVIGSNAEAYPELVQQMVDEGHEVGNHTFTHPNLSETPDRVVELELNATQRLFQALTGRSMRLFRPPYLGDAEPTDEDQIAPVQVAQDLGYITVGEHVDPVDWELPGVDKIVERAVKLVHEAKPNSPRNIILFHDAGGDRSQTVAALPILIEKLKAQGYRFVTTSALVGFSRDQAMPPLADNMSLFADRVVFYALSKFGRLLHWAFLLAIWLGIGRVLFLVILALRNLHNESRQARPPPALDGLRVSVVIPAYNEERVIAQSVRRILESTHRNLEVIVVDDGSKDDTLAVLTANFANDPRVALVSVPNGGKAGALNAGLSRAQGAVVVALDADTIFRRDAIARLARWFTDPEVGAVAGNAKVGNRINMITRWQALEYIGAQNLERRALAALGTLTVVPGAIGAWRRQAVEQLGGFSNDTVAEDQDLTIALQRSGYRVLFDSSAVAWTEAPTTFRGLARQRFRWAYGTLQCLWKYRSITFSRRYGALGLVALPQVWLFQIILTALAPVADLMLLWQLTWQGAAYLEHGAEFNNDSLIKVGLYYGLFVLLDMAAAGFGFLVEGREQKRLLISLPLQRFGYRQLMYYVVVRSIFSALKGAVVGWGKLDRTATVAILEAQETA